MQPDAVALVVAYLRAQEHLADVAVVTARPDNVAGRVPVLLVEAVGAPAASRMPWARRVHWHLGLQVWAADGEATGIARGALTALVAARDVRMPVGGRIVRADPAAEPIDIPDRQAGDVQRVVATVDVAVRA
ncbi:hypothetical protein KZZ52_51445 [Dactylosporangium sp. AC04546]|uniref:hypothetical protein n=1 Tax=Dactylosporangium sp. AC04546 TaxID=2862460 RepID=UPI001EDD5BEA|nr:hypothetical protein [Dactylosporangium sp. AC04546]WVK82278.1 hypothetical protein KZZ52_51445 [Dactylosporangium sp. AC04546]